MVWGRILWEEGKDGKEWEKGSKWQIRLKVELWRYSCLYFLLCLLLWLKLLPGKKCDLVHNKAEIMYLLDYPIFFSLPVPPSQTHTPNAAWWIIVKALRYKLNTSLCFQRGCWFCFQQFIWFRKTPLVPHQLKKPRGTEQSWQVRRLWAALQTGLPTAVQR